MSATYVSRSRDDTKSPSAAKPARSTPARSSTPSRMLTGARPAIRLEPNSLRTGGRGGSNQSDLDRKQNSCCASGKCGCGGKPDKCGTHEMNAGGLGGCPVPEWQEKLNITGARLTVDGVLGPATVEALKAFQTANPPLSVTGSPDPATWAVLNGKAPGTLGVPGGEVTLSHGWGSGGYQTTHRWKQRLTPTSIDFQGCQVTEADGGFVANTCWFPKSKYDQRATVTGGTWSVLAGNYWGDDYVGFATDAVNYYRQAGRAPCEASYDQLMKIVRAGGNVQYAKHRHVWRIGLTTVSSTRGNKTETRNYR